MHNAEMARAIDRSLDKLGEDSKKALLYHLTHTFKVPLEGCSIDELEGALRQILGEGAALVVASINNELRR